MIYEYKELSFEEVEKIVDGVYSYEEWCLAQSIAAKFYDPLAHILVTSTSLEYNDEGGYEKYLSSIEVYDEHHNTLGPGIYSEVEAISAKARWSNHFDPNDEQDVYELLVHPAAEELPHRNVTYDLWNPQPKVAPKFYIRVEE